MQCCAPKTETLESGDWKAFFITNSAEFIDSDLDSSTRVSRSSAQQGLCQLLNSVKENYTDVDTQYLRKDTLLLPRWKHNVRDGVTSWAHYLDCRVRTVYRMLSFSPNSE